MIRLTTSAEAYAGRQELKKTISAAAIGPEVAVGDLVSIEDGGQRHEFTVAARRWIVSDGKTSLELTLDHPVRRGL